MSSGFKKKIIFLKNSVFFFALGAFLVLGIFIYSLYSFAAWTSPTLAPPGGNVPEPINTGTFPQNKLGTFKIGTTSVPASVGNLFLYSGKAAIGTSTLGTAGLLVANSGHNVNVIDVNTNRIVGLSLIPINDSEATSKYYSDWVASTSKFWTGNVGGNIWSLNAGNVGIGTTNPGNTLHIYSNSGSFLKIETPVAGQMGGLRVVNGTANSQWDIGVGQAAGVGLAGLGFTNNGAGLTMLITNTGNVGIGTTNPGYLLDLRQSTVDALQLRIQGTRTGTGGVIDMDSTLGGGGRHYQIFSSGSTNADIGGGKFAIRDAAVAGLAGYRFVIDSTGNVGIATSSSATYRLDVNGSIRLSGDVKVGGLINIGPGDLAEEFYTDKDYPAGTVLVMDDHGYKSATACAKNYDANVIGVISENPGVVIGKIEAKYKAPVALTGVIKVRVNNTGGQINQGGLLTTSAVSGEAMLAASPKIGTIIGKALESDTGKGWIMAIVNLK
jgi:hypothetical protein